MRCPRVRQLELPPRARRILLAGLGEQNFGGTTSACAENTFRVHRAETLSRNYLRVRGEYSTSLPRFVKHQELPPRARRIRWQVISDRGWQGTTSACAENTRLCRLARGLRRNYLRVRGEYQATDVASLTTRELPPRARRIRGHDLPRFHHPGTTSACAENTMVKTTKPALRWNYLRVRGEYQ